MNKMLKIGVTTLLVVGFSLPSFARDDKKRFESSGFLKTLDAFIAEQKAKQRGLVKDEEISSLKELRLTLRPNSDQNRSFFQLSDSPSRNTLGGKKLSASEDLFSLLNEKGQLRGSNTQDYIATEGQFSLSFGGDKEDETDRGFEISLESALRLTPDDLQSALGYTNTGLTNREDNVGVTLGYAGFGVDASVTRQTSIFEAESFSYDLGFSYQARRWGARLSLSEYREGADLFGIDNETRSIVSVELGASYRLTNRIGIRGGVRYFGYGDQWLANPEAGENSQMIFLGGQLKF
ncbi:MAG: hypothetical protein COB37_03910 [Kordiimonadales bacterium]|nr:MAG: hypothetical protein COB37_03910 [Kordiimonadales bacterium]